MVILKNRSFKTIFTNTASQLIVRLTTSSAAFLATIIIAYFFGLKLFGSYTKIITFVSFFYLLIDFGINPIFLREYRQNLEKYILNLINLRFVISLVLILIVYLISRFLPYEPQSDTGFSLYEKTGILIFSFTIISYGLILSLNSLLQKNLNYKVSVLPNLISSVILILLIIIGGLQKNLFIILSAFFISGLITFFLTYIVCRKKFSLRLTIVKDPEFNKKILLSSLPLGIMLFVNLIYFKADTFILSLYKPSIDVGIYGFSYKIFEFIIALPTFFSNSVYPILLDKEKNRTEFNKHIKDYFLILFTFSLFGMIATFFLSPILAFIKIDFINAVLPLKILSFSLPFFFLTSLFQWVYIIDNKKNLLLGIYSVCMIVNIVLNIILIPKYSYISSAYITVFSEGLVLALMLAFLYIFKRENKTNGK